MQVSIRLLEGRFSRMYLLKVLTAQMQTIANFTYQEAASKQMYFQLKSGLNSSNQTLFIIPISRNAGFRNLSALVEKSVRVRQAVFQNRPKEPIGGFYSSSQIGLNNRKTEFHEEFGLINPRPFRKGNNFSFCQAAKKVKAQFFKKCS